MIEISADKVVQVIFQAREGAVAARELHAFIDGLNDDEKAHLTALAWAGRGDDLRRSLPPIASTGIALPDVPMQLEIGKGRIVRDDKSGKYII